MTPALTLLGERYELLGVIGAGGFCEVWRARDRVLERQVAVKILDAKYARDPEALARFRAEAQNAGCLTHVNVARVYDFGEPRDGDLPFLVMELVDGPTLADLLAEGPLDPARAMDVVAQAAAGLQAAHAAGLVHRDVKPGNLLIGTGGVVKVADFGISHTVDSAPMTCTGIVIGSPGYVAPERASGARASQASDLYALGVVAYECLTGAPPFSGTGLEVALAHLNLPFPPLPPRVPAEMAALVARLTDKDPANRPASAGVVAEHAIRLRDQPATASGPVAVQAAGHGDVRPSPLRPSPLRRARPRPGGRTAPAPAGFWRAGVTRWRITAAVAAAVAGLGIFLVSGLDDASSAHQIGGSSRPVAAQLGQTGQASPAGRARDAAAQTALVRRSLIGQPVSRAVRELRGEGLKVHLIWRRASGCRPGRVLSVRPLGRHRMNSTVTVIGVRAPARRHPGHRHRARSGQARPGGTPMTAPAQKPGPARHGPAKPKAGKHGPGKPKAGKHGPGKP